MNGRSKVAQHKARVDATFERAKGINASDLELRADMAKYLCVMVSGFLERAVSEMLLEHARKNGSPTLQKFVEDSTRSFTNANCEKLKKILGSFEAMWRSSIELLLVDEVKDAIDSLVANRHVIAHGGSLGITYSRVLEYYKHVQAVVDKVTDLCDPI